MDFIVDKIEYIVAAVGLLISFYVVEGANHSGKNYGDITALVRQHKKIQQATNIKSK